MNFKKIASSVAASAVAASALAVSASAGIVVPENLANGCSAGTGQIMVKLLVPSEDIDYGIDVLSIDHVKVVITPEDKDFFEGQTGGGLVFSCGPTSVCPSDHNWASSNYWGIIDEDLGIDTQNPDELVKFKKIGDYTYEGTVYSTPDNCFYPEVLNDDGCYIQFCYQEWGNDMSDMEVLSITMYDKSENVVIAFDGSGNVTQAKTSGGNAAASAPAADNAAPAAGNVAAATDSSKGSPDTGIADAAAVAGLAIVAAGALVISKKRK